MAKKRLVLKPGGPVAGLRRCGRPPGSKSKPNGVEKMRRDLLELASQMIALATRDL